MPVQETEDEKEIVVIAEMPGVRPDAIDLRVKTG
jgi:HSP20 family molecular chaperone IbpA